MIENSDNIVFFGGAGVNTDEESFFYPSIGLSGIISEMVKLPEFISYLKVSIAPSDCQTTRYHNKYPFRKQGAKRRTAAWL